MGWLAGQKITAQRLIDNTPHTISYTAINANTATTTTTEVIGITTGIVTFEAGRAYRITFKGQYQSSVTADQVFVRVRKTDTSGTAYVDSFRLVVPTGNGTSSFYLSNICTNGTVADISAALVGTYARVSGTGNVFIVAGATNPTYIEVEDVGLGADFPSASPIT